MKNTFKILTLCSSVALLLGTAQVAQAHSGFKTNTLSSADTTGTTWNAINVTHGCGDKDKKTTKDVIALSILFPVAANQADFAANVLASKGLSTALTSAAATKAAIVPNYDPAVDFDFGTTGTAPAPVISNPTPSITALTAGNIFPNTIPVAVNGKIVGFQSWLGKPYAGGSPIVETAKDEITGSTVSTTGSGIFGLSKIVFKATSCVKTLKIYAASVNWCESGKPSFTSKTRLDAWVEAADTVFSTGAETDSIQDATYPPKLTINRDVIKTPLPADCAGVADTVILQPSTAFVNKYTPIKSAKWPAGTSGQLFWPTVK
ncbi:MAG: hypothetical protein QG557_1105 [Pseudomonadota bacterium]|nr:hypothetical protein [Pseudomonadota bacterium]